MMFSLKIFFLGLIVFVPSPDGTELTVLLVDGRQGYTASDGTELGTHAPHLLARAAGCQGNCSPSPDVAEFFFSKYGSGASERLTEALVGGGAWRLSESELSLTARSVSLALEHTRKGAAKSKSALPADPLEARDVRWIADLAQIDPRVGGVAPDHLAERPFDGWVVARLRLRNGRISTYRLAGYGDQVAPIEFRPLVGGAPSGYSQALADSVVAEIEIEGNSVEIVEESFGGGARRHMRLFPLDGVVEMALLNTPPSSATHADHGAPNTDLSSLPGPGKHFEIFYELARVKPAKADRAIPHVDPNTRVPWSRVQERRSSDSKLLQALGFDDPRTVFQRIICPPGWLAP